MSKVPLATLLESNSRSSTNSPIIFQLCGECLVFCAREIGALNFEFERLAYAKKSRIGSGSATHLQCWISGRAGTLRETTEPSMDMRYIWTKVVSGVEESTYQGKHNSLRQIGD
ncbi:uncharacterized protein EAE97_007220 [Botrytis byssoidea]|uniref:Uncharacterized protein n=1 Tax=Botrytis byssoidea TaxID=139641 RepID=A0A9P5IHQ7_9HELO|nr:uncharacterized protein EAE97_007220 [Botrytis byssoidea]KAF7939139.1 hypothetical protein EAE97_007220 [Botrytis byssoidea]